MNTKDFLPPILMKLFRKCKQNDVKEYESYHQAMQFCADNSYQNIELVNMIADKTINYIKQLNEKPYNLSPINVFLLSAINQILNINSKNDIKILDFGGACGAHYFEIRRFIPKKISIKWFVIETGQMVESAIKKGLKNEELSFFDSLQDIKTDIDIIYSSGALQYVSDPYEYTNNLINIKADWLLFNRMMFNNSGNDIITIQKTLLSSNGNGNFPEGYIDRMMSYPHTTMSLQRFNSIMEKGDYELEWTIEEKSGIFQINKNEIIGKGLLYMRKS